MVGLLLWMTLSWASAAEEGAPMSPEEAVRIALAAAPSVDAQDAAVTQARRDLTVAGVDMAPRIDLQAGYTRLSAVDLPPLDFGGMVIDNPFKPILDNYSVKGTVTFPVSDLFFSLLPAYKARADALKLQEAQYDVERTQVAYNTLEAYYSLVRVRAGMDVAAHGVRVLEAYLAQLEDLFEAGQVTQADVLSTKAQLAEVRAQYQELVRTEAVAEAHLLSLLDMPGPVVVEQPVAESSTFEARTNEELLEVAKAQRPEVRVLTELIDTHIHAARAQRGAALPHLALVGNATYANPNQRITPPTEKFYGTWDASAVITWSPNASIKAANDASQSKTDEIQARADLEKLERGLSIQVAKALADLRAASELIEVNGEQLEAAEAAFEAQSDLLGVGAATPADTLQADAMARRARLRMVDSRVGLAVAELELLYVIGELLPPSMEIE